MARNVLGLEIFTKYLQAAGRSPFPDQLRTAIGWYLNRSIKRTMAGKSKPLSGLTKQNRRNAGDAKPLQDTGALKKSIDFELVLEGVEVGSPLPYAEIHQFGGFIRPRRAQKLAIPATQVAARWSEAFGVRGAIEAFKRNFGPVSFGPGAIFCQGEPIFWRLDEVRIPARPFIRMTPEREKHIQEMVADFFLKMRV